MHAAPLPHPRSAGAAVRALTVAAAGCLALAATAGTAAATSAPAGGTASGGTHATPKRLSIARVKPLAHPGGTSVVVLELKGKPLATALSQAKAAHRALSQADRSSTVSALRPAQQRVSASVRSMGGTVRYTYSAALAGLSVSVKTADIPRLAALPDVSRVLSTSIVHPALNNSDNLSKVPQEWSSSGGTGTGEVIGVIDTGIDFYHADFGGSGMASDFANANRTGGTAFPTAKVIGGTDLVGDAYDPNKSGPAFAPKPDPIPLDCTDNGAFPHGTHVSGDAAGQGVLSSGATYTGLYTDQTFSSNMFKVYPGSAPEAKLRVYRVFGCGSAESSASSDVIGKAIDDAVQDNVNVINLSLGQTFAEPTDVDSVAAANAVTSGIPTVIAAGNEGPGEYTAGSPGSTPSAITVGAVDGQPGFPGASYGSTPPVQAINANGSTDLPVTAPVVVLKDAPAKPAGSTPRSLGCDASDYDGTKGTIVITNRGTCARVARAQFGQDAGAAAVVMINNANSLPPYEGSIPTTDGSGTVTIPFLGVSKADAGTVNGTDGRTITITSAGTIANPSFKAPASFTSAGPDPGDSSSKPDVAAAGVSVTSASAGTGTGALTASGTSFATPTTAGIVADVLQVNPGISADFAKAAVDETADPTAQGYDPLLLGAGIANAQAAVATKVYETTGDGKTSGLSFGYQQLGRAYSGSQVVTLTNTGTTAAVYNLAITPVGPQYGANETITPAVTVPPGGSSVAVMTISLTAAQVAALPDALQSDPSGLLTVDTLGGTVIATPTTSTAEAPALSIPYRMVPRGISVVTPGPLTPYTSKGSTATTSTVITNRGIHRGGSDIYAWQIADPSDSGVPQQNDVRDVGVAVLPGSKDTEVDFVFDVVGRWSQPGNDVEEIAIDTNRDGTPDFYLVGEDFGLATSGTPTGEFASILFTADGTPVDAFDAGVADNGNMVVLPSLVGDLGNRSGAFSYRIDAVIGQNGPTTEDTTSALLDPAHPPVSSGDGGELEPGGSRTAILTADTTQLQSTPALGWLVSTFDDANGTGQLNELPLGTTPPAPTGGPAAALPDATAPVLLVLLGVGAGAGALVLRRRRHAGVAA